MAEEDIDYTVSDFATPEKESRVPDPDQEKKSVLIEILEELEKDIATNTSFDSITLPANATPAQKIAAFDDMAIHKGLALHLKKYQLMISNKLKELV